MKVVVIGGGSYQWGPNVVNDLLITPSLEPLDLVLEDIDPRPLPDMARWAERAADAHGRKVSVTTSTDQRAALEGADAVIVTISTGGFRSMAHDLAVPARYGIKQSVGDSVGPGGISRALRNIPVLVGIARDMEEVCPDAWLLNITNPMTTLTRAVRKATSIKAVGLCHEVAHVTWEIALMHGAGFDDVRLTVAGVNHFPVVTRCEVRGEDVLPDLLRLAVDGAEDEPADTPAWQSRRGFAQRNQLKLALLARYGALPAAGDRHLAEFLGGVLTEESGFGADYGIHLTTIADREEHQGSYVQRLAALVSGAEEVPTFPSGEMAAPVLDSLVTGTVRRLPLNLPNTGQAADLPADAVVETMCRVDGNGLHGETPVRLPAALAELVRRHVAVQELTVEAALSGDRSLALAAFALDPLAGRGDLRRTEQMAEELLAATAEWLPQLAAAAS